MRQGGPGLRLAWEVGPGRWEIARRHSNPLRAETFFVPLSSVRVFEVVVKRSSRQGPATELSNEPGMMGFENWNWARQDWEQPSGKHHAVGECVNLLGRKTWHQTAETQRLGEDGTYVRVFYYVPSNPGINTVPAEK